MKTKAATQHSPGIPGWKWASGLKPRKGDKFLYSDRSLGDLDLEEATKPKHPPHCLSVEHYVGYIRRIRKTKPNKPKSNLPKARVMWSDESARDTTYLPLYSIRKEAVHAGKDGRYGLPQIFAVTPCATRKEAAALVAKHNRRAAR